MKRLDNERRAALVDDLEANYFKLEKKNNNLVGEIMTLNEGTVILQKLLQNLTVHKSELAEEIEEYQDSLSVEKAKSKFYLDPSN